MKRNVIILIMSLIILMVSCESEAPPKIETTDYDHVSSGFDETQHTDEKLTPESNYSEDIAAILSKVKGDYSCNVVPCDRRYVSFTYDKTLYVLLDRLYELNFTTGRLQSICRDPLCRHTNSNSCVAAAHYLSFYADSGSIFALGEYSKNDTGYRFIGTLDPEIGKQTVLNDWLGSISANSNSFEYHDGFLYYTKPTSDTTNELFRYSVKSKKEEQLSNCDEYIVVFAIYDGTVYFRNNYGILKYAALGFSDVHEIDDKVSIMFPRDGFLYYFVNSYDENGKKSGYDLLRKPLDDIDADADVIIQKIFNPSKTLYDDGSFYYTSYEYAKDKTLYKYDALTAETISWNIDYGSRCEVLAVIENLFVLKLYTEPDENGETLVEYYLYDTNDQNRLPLIID